MPSSGGHGSRKPDLREAPLQTRGNANAQVKSQTIMEADKMDIAEQFAAIGTAIKKVVQDGENANREMQKTVAEVKQAGLQAAEAARRDSQAISEQTRKEAADMLAKLGDDLNKYATRDDMDKLTAALNTFSKGTRARLDAIEGAIFETQAPAQEKQGAAPARMSKLDAILSEIRNYGNGLKALEARVSAVEKRNNENGSAIAQASKNIADVLALLQKQFTKA